MDKGAGKHIIKTLSNAKNYTHICSLYISEYYADAIKEMALKHVPNRLITSTKQTERGFYPAEYLGEFATEVKERACLSNSCLSTIPSFMRKSTLRTTLSLLLGRRT